MTRRYVSAQEVIYLLPQDIQEKITDGDISNILRALVAGLAPEKIAEEYRSGTRQTGYRTV